MSVITDEILKSAKLSLGSDLLPEDVISNLQGALSAMAAAFIEKFRYGR